VEIMTRFWKSAGLWTGSAFLLLLLFIFFEILVQSPLPVAEHLKRLGAGIPGVVGFVLPVGGFAAGFACAGMVVAERDRIRARLGGVALGALLLALVCFVLVGYVHPFLESRSGLTGEPALYAHAWIAAWPSAPARLAAVPGDEDLRTAWRIVQRALWCVLVSLSVGIGVVGGFWAQWSPSRRVVALQAWVLLGGLWLSLMLGTMEGKMLVSSGQVLQGAWVLVRFPLLALVILAWPTWLVLRHPLGLRVRQDGGPAT
jgi:hypothetical protein